MATVSRPRGAAKPLDGLDGSFRSQVEAMVRASGGRVWVVSAARSRERQEQLWAGALKKYGDPEIADNYVARPGTSHHESGIAVDLDGDLDWVRQNAPRFGLYQPMSWEPWHWEPASGKSASGKGYTKPQTEGLEARPGEDKRSVGYQLSAIMEKIYERNPQANPLHHNKIGDTQSASEARTAALERTGKDPGKVAAMAGGAAADMGRYQQEQRDVAATIARIGRAMGFGDEEIAGAISAGLVESGLRNLRHGDRDSQGVFQQRPSQGWGSVEQVTNVDYAARKFFDAFRGSKGATVAERVANTQRPAKKYRGRYAERMDEAWSILRALGG